MWYQRHGKYINVNVYVQPSAKHTEIAGFHGEALKIRLHAPPIKGRANDVLIKFIATLFAVPTHNVLLKSGDKSRYKSLIITNSTIDPSSIELC